MDIEVGDYIRTKNGYIGQVKAKIRFTFLRDKCGVPKVKDGKRWILDNYRYNCTDLDIIYDLIKADLVEKVEELGWN